MPSLKSIIILRTYRLGKQNFVRGFHNQRMVLNQCKTVHAGVLHDDTSGLLPLLEHLQDYKQLCCQFTRFKQLLKYRNKIGRFRTLFEYLFFISLNIQRKEQIILRNLILKLMLIFMFLDILLSANTEYF